MRLRRLQADWEAMQALAESSPFIDVTATGTPPEAYVITLRCHGLRREDEVPVVTSYHRFTLFLPAFYPRVSPQLTWLTPIFHPNILSTGGVCIGFWTPAESLADLCVRIAEMVQYQSYNMHDPLDRDAAAWAAAHPARLPVDTRPLMTTPRQPAQVLDVLLEDE